MNCLLRDIPNELHSQIKELAKKEKRSWSSQALILLELALNDKRDDTKNVKSN